MKDWRTTTMAAITAFFGFVLFAPEYFQGVPWLVSIAKYVFAGGLVAFGISARDYHKKNGGGDAK